MREAIYITYDEQDAYREAGWEIKPLTHSYMKEYSLMAVRKIEEDKNSGENKNG